MKKTIIAFLALSGLVSSAFAADYNNVDSLISTMNTKLDALGYKAGDSFAITFSIESLGYSGQSANIIRLGSLGDLRIQAGDDGTTSAYLGIRYNGGEAWYTNPSPSTSTTWSGDHYTASWDAETQTNALNFDGAAGLWLTMGANGKNQANGLLNTPITISYDKGTNSVSLSLTVASGVTDTVTFANTTLNAGAITRLYNNTKTNNLTVVPEPATATLSLLALAALAARRRRH